MILEKQISGLAELSNFITHFLGQNPDLYTEDEEDFSAVLRQSHQENSWFTLESQKHALKQWANLLQKKEVEKWVRNYKRSFVPKKVGLILAGNIPLVGFHDVLAVILSGHIPLVKLSSKDRHMIPFLLKKWRELSETSIDFEFTDRLSEYDAVIATGSNNTARYLDYYFKDTLSIIRKNRTSVAVLSGDETSAELELLAEDIFTYFGLGCRNVTRLFIPHDFLIDRLFESFIKFKEVINHHKYANNYEYNRAIYLLNQEKFWDNNFVMLKEDESLFSPLSVLNFTRYQNLDEVKDFILSQKENIQTVVARGNLGLDSIPFGEAQNPTLDTYADNVDTMQFLEVI